jgi:hypothetical protein
MWYEHWPEDIKEKPRTISVLSFWRRFSQLAVLHSAIILRMKMSERGMLLVFDIYNILGIMLFYCIMQAEIGHSIPKYLNILTSATAYICGRDSLVTILNSLAAPGLGNRSFYTRRVKIFSSFRSIHSGSGTHLAS